ncbi:MAG TPA: PHP domain-containing protein, partial [Caldilineaceae bacterium]|nr:PHP domain-containing protein [Caldilineaceae bacterium]
MASAPDSEYPPSPPADLPVPGLTHLHVHSHYTLLGATPPVAELARRAAAQGMSHLALTDTNALYGAVAFARACAREGITPLIGMTITVAQPAEVRGALWATAGELVLIASNPEGWRSLCALSSAIQNRPDRKEQARRGVDWEMLRAHRVGLICLAGGRRSWLGRCLAAGDPASAGRYVSRLGGIYGEDAVLAIELHRPEDHGAANAVVELGKRFGLPVAVVHPVYCLTVEERARLPLLAALAHNCPIAELPPALLPDEGDAQVDLHWLTPAELAARYAAYPQALAQVGEVARRCVPALPDGRPLWPALPWAKEQTPDETLRRLAEEGMAQRYGNPSPVVVARLEQELAAIAR